MKRTTPHSHPRPWIRPVGEAAFKVAVTLVILNGIAGPILRNHYGWDDVPAWMEVRMYLMIMVGGYALGYFMGREGERCRG